MDILLESKKNKTAFNVDNSAQLELSTKCKPLPEESMTKNIDLYQIYNSEFDNCENFRLFFTVKPYCTNVLFNPITEVVYKEGSDECISLETETLSKSSNIFSVVPGNSTKDITIRQAVRDTEYNNPEIGGLKYNNGIDIFNNHYLRSNGFFKIGDLFSYKNKSDSSKFNTLSDLYRDSDGEVKKIIREVPKKSGDYNGSYVKLQAHIFNKDNTMPFIDAVRTNLEEDNGWFGFRNRPYANIPNYHYYDKDITINRIMNDREACDFVDLYPDRSLFSFVPKINGYRMNREEYNWNWCITYPARNYNTDKNPVDFLKRNFGLTVIYRSGEDGIVNRYDNKYVFFRTKVKHNLRIGDMITLRYSFLEESNAYTNASFRIYSLGNEEGDLSDYYFCISYDDLAYEFTEKEYTLSGGRKVIGIEMPDNIYVRKVKNGFPVSYYIREFKKIDGKYQHRLSSVLNKVAFSNTIYNDSVSQIMFIDDIELKDKYGKDITDNLGRPLSEVYLTVVKNNAGYKEWYYQNRYNDEKVEYSHCFGKVTSGFDFESNIKEMGEKRFSDRLKDYNVRCISNVPVDGYIPKKMEEYTDEITIDNEYFIGDIVEYDPTTCTETVIEDIMHRFNTAQREYNENDKKYDNIYHDEIDTDDYDYISDDGNIEEVSEFNIARFNVSEDIPLNPDGRGNIFPEGYFYKPHYRVVLRKYSDYLHQGRDILLNYSKDDGITIGTDRIYVKSSLPLFYSRSNTVRAWYEGRYEDLAILDVSNDGFHYEIEKWKKLDDGSADIRPKLFIRNVSIPEYAQYVNDGSGYHIWRDFLKNSKIDPEDEEYGRVFSNGAIYSNTNINFYLKRQDPECIYGLQFSKNGTNPLKDVTVSKVNMPKIDAEYKIVEKFNGICRD